MELYSCVEFMLFFFSFWIIAFINIFETNIYFFLPSVAFSVAQFFFYFKKKEHSREKKKKKGQKNAYAFHKRALRKIKHLHPDSKSFFQSFFAST